MIKRFLYIFTSLLLSLFPIVPTFAISDTDLDFFAENDIVFYDPSGSTSGTSTTGSSSGCFDSNGTGVISGNNLTEKVWNYFITAGIPNVSTDPAVIAGIMGNLQQESGFNPFARGASGKYHGIYQTDDDVLISQINANGWSDYWGTTNAPNDVVDKALKIELDYLTQTNNRFTTINYAFLKQLSAVSSKTPEAYAELFEVSVEGAVTSNTSDANKLLDVGVINVGTRFFSHSNGGGKYYQEVDNRRKNAVKIYNDYKDITSTSVATSSQPNTSNGSNITMIGDSITFGSQSALKEKMPEIDIYAEVGKHFALNAASNKGGESGIAILTDIINNNNLRDILVFALGTNDISGFGQEQANKVLELASGKTIIFVTNYTKKADYTSNNNIFKMLAQNNSNVIIADWKNAIQDNIDDYIGSDGIHPNPNGQKLFAEVIYSAINNTPSAGHQICNVSYDTVYLWSQADSRWASKPYGSCSGDTSIKAAGCGPTSLAMIISTMTGREVTPDIIADEAANAGYRACGNGSYHNITKLAENYGLTVTYASGSTAWNEPFISQALREGKMIHISSSGSNPFPQKGGHFIAIRGITESGNWLIFDSGKWENQEKEFTPSELLSANNRPLGETDVYIVSR